MSPDEVLTAGQWQTWNVVFMWKNNIFFDAIESKVELNIYLEGAGILLPELQIFWPQEYRFWIWGGTNHYSGNMLIPKL